MSKLVPLLLFNVFQSAILFIVRTSVSLLFLLVQMQAVVTPTERIIGRGLILRKSYLAK